MGSHCHDFLPLDSRQHTPYVIAFKRQRRCPGVFIGFESVDNKKDRITIVDDLVYIYKINTCRNWRHCFRASQPCVVDVFVVNWWQKALNQQTVVVVRFWLLVKLSAKCKRIGGKFLIQITNFFTCNFSADIDPYHASKLYLLFLFSCVH